jgi:hypothetical protein
VEEQAYFYRYADGSLVRIDATNTVPQPPEGAVEITQAEYEAGIAAIEQQRQQDLEATQAAELAAAQDAYNALIAAGIPEATARHLSRYTPPDPTQD